jgi:plasmid stability protein
MRQASFAATGSLIYFSCEQRPEVEEGTAMTITIQLPPELEEELKSRAARQGMEVETLVVETLRQDLLRRITPGNDQLRALAAKLPPPVNWFDADEERPF